MKIKSEVTVYRIASANNWYGAARYSLEVLYPQMGDGQKNIF
jgi:hypothetical protein